MPTLLRTRGFRFLCFHGEHPPPHVHVRRGGEEILLRLPDTEPLAGGMAPKDLRLARAIARRHADAWYALFHLLNPHVRRADHRQDPPAGRG